MPSRGLLCALSLLFAAPIDSLSSVRLFSPASSPGPSAQRRPLHASPSRGCRVVLSEEQEESQQQGSRSTPDTFQERLRLFGRLALPYFERAEGAKLNFGLMVLLVLINSAVSVTFSYVGRDFYSALSAKDQALFLEKTANFAAGLAVATPLTVLYKFQRQRCAPAET